MARTTKQLTNTEVKQAKPRGREYNLAHGHGLYLRVKPNGAKLWLFQYFKPFIKKRTNISNGKCPAVSLADARKQAEALELLAEIKDIDLLFTDIVMPGGMNGKEPADRAEQEYPRLKVLFTSG